MVRSVSFFVLFSAFTLSGTLFAEQPASDEQSDAAPSTNEAAGAETIEAPAPTKPLPSIAANIPRDPAGIQGVSPFWEQTVKGDAAYLSRNLSLSQSFYNAAVTQNPEDPKGHLRLAELQLSQNNLKAALDSAANALQLAGNDLRSKAQASFLIAKIRERQNADEAIVSWRAYKSLESQLPPAEATNASTLQGKGPLPTVIYSKSADQRISAIETVKKLNENYAAVRQRIEKGLKEAEDAAVGK